jgi:hypothetical protein
MSHLLDQLELEVLVADPAEARQLQERLSRLHHQVLAEVLARVLDQLSPPGTLHRLESLTLELGAIPADQLERQFPERLEQALRQTLPARLLTAQRRPQPATDPLALPRPDQAPNPTVSDRDPLQDVCPARPPQDALDPSGPPGPASANSPGPAAVSPGAGEPGRSTPRPGQGAPEASPLELLDWFAATGTLPWWAPRHDSRLIPTAMAAALRLPPEVLTPFLRQLAAAPTAQQRLLAGLDASQRLAFHQAGMATPGEENTKPPLPSPHQPPHPQAPAPPPHSLQPPRQRLDRLRELPEPTAILSPPDQEGRRPPPRDQSAEPRDPQPRNKPSLPSAGDTITVDGAGLTLLWPFLERLYDRLNWLTAERDFVNGETRMRAMALLGYLVDGDPEPPEWRLTLAKLLCGGPLETPYALQEPLRGEELAEADKLLQAVLAHGDGLLGDEVATLRETWLQRPGRLRWRPQAWLLVVDPPEGGRETVARLPWSLTWIRLPWMAELLQVAW